MSEIIRGFDYYLGKVKESLACVESGNYEWHTVTGLLIIKLSNTDSIKSNKIEENKSNATQIQLTAEQDPAPGASKTEDFFPTLTLNSTFKGWRISLPARINTKNICELLGSEYQEGCEWKDESIQIRRRLLNKTADKAGNPALQICYGNDLMPLRQALEVNDYLVFVKRTGCTTYDAFGIKSLVDLGNGKNMFSSEKAKDDSSVFDYKAVSAASETTQGENILLYGVPGSGKSRYIKDHYKTEAGCMERVVFHPDYTYSDFVGQILPRIVEDANASGKHLSYEFVPGPFTNILSKAIHDENGKQYYLVIEEINRGNAPAIFGEIFQLLDRVDSGDNAGESEYGITNFDIANEIYKDPTHEIKIPSNLSILATMNTSDQNVFTLDTAFQRRWIMRHIDNDVMSAIHANDTIDGSKITWGAFALTINREAIRASEGLTSAEDKRLGAYFVTKRELMKDRFPEKVLKYLWDDAFRMERERVFSPEMDSLDKVIGTFISANGHDPLKLILKPSVYEEMYAAIKGTSSEAEQNDEVESVAPDSGHEAE